MWAVFIPSEPLALDSDGSGDDDGDGSGDGSGDGDGSGVSHSANVTLAGPLSDKQIKTVPFIWSSVSHTAVTAMVLVTLSLSVTVALQR